MITGKVKIDPRFEKNNIVMVREASNWESVPQSGCSGEESI